MPSIVMRLLLLCMFVGWLGCVGCQLTVRPAASVSCFLEYQNLLPRHDQDAVTSLLVRFSRHEWQVEDIIQLQGEVKTGVTNELSLDGLDMTRSELALACIYAAAGPSILPSYTETKEVLSRQVAGDIYRYHINKVDDQNVAEVVGKVDAWIAGYLCAQKIR